MAKASKKSAKKSSAEYDIDDNDGETHEGFKVDQDDNLTLITTGYRVRAQEEGHVAELPGSPSDFEDLKAKWQKAISKIKEAHYVLGAGKNGIFSELFASTTDRLALRDNTYAFSRGLGLVGFAEKYPQYKFPVNEESLQEIVEDFNRKEWAMFTNEQVGPTLEDVIRVAVAKKHRVIVAAVGGHGFIYPEMLKGIEKDADVIKRLRFCGPKIDMFVPSGLLGCVMPMEKEALDVCVPGAPAHGTRRLAALLQAVSPASKSGISDPLADCDAIEKAYKDKTLVEFDSRTNVNTKKSLSDEDLLPLVQQAVEVVGRRADRITKILKGNGVRIRASRVEEVLANL